MSDEQERLPRAVELAAKIVAAHVRRTETSPKRFASLLMTAFQGIKAIELEAANSGRFTAALAEAGEDQAIAMAPAAQPATLQPVLRQPAPRQASHAGVLEPEPGLSLDDEPAESAAPRARRESQLSPEEDRASGFIRNGRQSVYHNRLICLDDGKEVTFLRRYLRQRNIDENDYRERWNLPADYPMTTQAYVDDKKAHARNTGFGTTVRPNRERREPEPRPAAARAPRQASGLQTAAQRRRKER
jgi:predicted transcriptional regulator